jgi:putative membrane protein
VPDATEPAAEPPRRPRRRATRLIVRAPRTPISVGIIVALASVMAVATWWPTSPMFLPGWAFAFVLPALVSAVATTPLVEVFGGRLEFHRSIFLVLTTLVLQVPLALAWMGAAHVWPGQVPPLVLFGPFLAAPAFWFRHLTLFGVARPRHAPILAASLLQPVLFLLGFFLLVPPSVAVLAATGVLLAFGFVCAVVVLHAADRPIQREFHRSGVSLIRPLLDHVGERDPKATERLESFFRDGSAVADLRVRMVGFFRDGGMHAAWVLPTVHPGPFGALGASDLPRKIEEALGPSAGTVFVPHTPCDHDLDLPSGDEVGKVTDAARTLLAGLRPSVPSRASGLVSPYPGSTARAQVIGDLLLVVLSRAPEPTDDIAYAVADRIVRDFEHEGLPAPLLVDGHNSYIEGQGDITYGSPAAERLATDAMAAAKAALAASVAGPISVGTARRAGYSIGDDGIGPEGMRAFAVRSGTQVTGYVLIDGNNLMIGARQTILDALLKVVDTAEVMTTDNHVVHEVDGGINPVGERYPASALARDAAATLRAAVADLGEAQVAFAQAEVPSVPVLGPNYTARLLTSLGDTLAMFTNIFPASLVLLLTSSLVVAYVVR